jgi:hypothetical protein
VPEEKDKRPPLDERVKRGFSGFRVLLDQRTGRVDAAGVQYSGLAQKQDGLEADMAKLTERVARLEGHKEGIRDGREDTTRTLNEVKEVRKEVVEEKKLGIESWKATAPIIIAVVTGIFGLITGIIALLQAFLGGHSGH